HPADATTGAVGAKIRLQILASLVEGELTVGELCKRLHSAEPTVRRHLAVLRRSGIVAGRWDKKRVHYRLGTRTRHVAPGVVDVALDAAFVRLTLPKLPPHSGAH